MLVKTLGKPKRAAKALRYRRKKALEAARLRMKGSKIEIREFQEPKTEAVRIEKVKPSGRLVEKLTKAGLLPKEEKAAGKPLTTSDKIQAARRRVAERMDKRKLNTKQERVTRAAYASLSADTL